MTTKHSRFEMYSDMLSISVYFTTLKLDSTSFNVKSPSHISPINVEIYFCISLNVYVYSWF